MSRYPYLALLLAVAGGFIVVTTFAFDRGSANSIDFAVSIAVTVGALAAAAVAPGRGQRAAGAGIALLGAWTILVTLGIFSGATQQWLVFASGAAITAISLGAVAAYVRDLDRAAARPNLSGVPQAVAA